MPLVVPDLNSPSASSQGQQSTQEWTSKLLGKKLTDSGPTNEVNFAKADLPSKHRVVDHEGGMMTMDHIPDRLNVHVDKDGTVRKVTHG